MSSMCLIYLTNDTLEGVTSTSSRINSKRRGGQDRRESDVRRSDESYGRGRTVSGRLWNGE